MCVALNILTAKLGAWDLTNGLQSIISLVCVLCVFHLLAVINTVTFFFKFKGSRGRWGGGFN